MIMSINAPNRIKKKYLDSDSVDGSKVLFLNEESFRAKNSTNEDIELFKLSSNNKFTLLKLPSVSISPIDMYDIVNKKYVDDEVYAEKTRAMMSEVELESSISDEEARAKARENELESLIEEEASLRASEDIRVLNEAKLYTDTEVQEEASLRASEDIRILQEAKAYTDSEIFSNVTDQLGKQNGIATLDSSGKISASQLPAITLTDVHVVTTLAQRDALTVQEGDVVKVTEAVTSSDGTKLPRTYIWAVDNITQIGNWLDIVTESDVDSVNGYVGHIVLNTGDIGELGDNRYFTLSRETQVLAYTDTKVEQEAIFRASEDVRVLEEAKSYTDSEVQEEASLRASEDVRVLEEAKDYADTKVVDTLSGNESDKAPSVRAFKEFVYDIGEQYQVDSFIVDNTIISQNYIELSAKAFAMSIVPSISRLMLLEGDDYTVSVVSGKTRLTFVNSLLSNGEEALEIGDRIRIRYLKDLRA